MTTMDILRRTKAAWPSICNASAEDKTASCPAWRTACRRSAMPSCAAMPRTWTLHAAISRMSCSTGSIWTKIASTPWPHGIRATVALPDHTGRILAADRPTPTA